MLIFEYAELCCRRKLIRPTVQYMLSVIIHINRDLNISGIIWGIAMQKKLCSCMVKVWNSYFCMTIISTKIQKSDMIPSSEVYSYLGEECMHVSLSLLFKVVIRSIFNKDLEQEACPMVKQ